MVVGVHYVESDVPVQHLRHQGVECSAAGGNGVQDIGAVRFPLDGVLDGLDLPAQAADAIEHFLFVADDVSQKPPPCR